MSVKCIKLNGSETAITYFFVYEQNETVFIYI